MARLHRLQTVIVGLIASLSLTSLVAAQAGAPAVSTFQHDPDVYVDVSQYGQARHIVADNFGRFIMAYVDTGPALTLSYSNDRAASWIDVPLGVGTSPNRPALAYDPVNDRLHMVYQVNGAVGASGLTYRRYTILRDGSGNITGFASDGALELDPFNTRRPTLLWTPDGGPNGGIVVAWSRTNDSGSRQEIRASMRQLSNSAADFSAANWQAPDGSPDTSPITLPNVPFNLLEGIDSAGVGDSAIACVVQRGGAGPNGRDLYVVYSMFGGGLDEWRWRKADWNGAAGNWSGSADWLPANTVVAGSFGVGSGSKQLSLSCLYDDVNDQIWFSAARGAGGQDIVSLYGIAPGDTTMAAGDVDSVSAPASRQRMTAIGFDPTIAGGEVWVIYISGNASTADGFVRYRTYRPGLGFSGAGDVYAVASNNYPNLLERRDGDLLLGMFRTNTTPYTLRRATIQFPASGTPTPTSPPVTPTASPTATTTSTATATDTPSPTPSPTATLPPGAFSATHSSVADFTGCGPNTNISIASTAGGELRLAAVLEDYFDNPAIDYTRWITGQLYDYGGAFPPTVTNGILAINGSYIRSVAPMTQPTRVFEARIQLRVPPANTAWGDVGFGRQNAPGLPDPVGHNRLFITNDANQIFANARNDENPVNNQLLAGVDPAEWHIYRIEWGQNATSYYVDGVYRATDNQPSTYQPFVWLYTLNPGGTVQVDWARIDFYPNTTGQFQSCTIDAGQTTTWNTLTWSGSVPAAAGASFQTRTSPDAINWSPWSAPFSASGSSITSPAERYLQYRITFTTGDSIVSPQVDQVTVTGLGGGNPTPTATDTPSPTATATNTPTATNSLTATNTPTATATNSLTATSSPTATSTQTATRTSSPTATSTPSPTASATNTPTRTPTSSPTATSTPTATAPVLTCVDLTPAADTYLSGDKEKNNYGNNATLRTDSEEKKPLRALLQFNVSTIPSSIQSATLFMNLYASSGSTTDRVNAHRVTAQWAESQATWNNRLTGIRWANPGGDVSAVVESYFVVSPLGWKTLNLTTLAESWRLGTVQNYGVLLESPNISGNNEKTYGSSEASNVSLRPYLRVCYYR
jgi:hypothetical protein